jgi:tetratricopeptide (TPR) repeat protein
MAFFILLTTTQDRVKVAASFKAKGNAAYQAKNFEEAAELYTKAIQVSPKPEPVFYSNRAACTYLIPRTSICSASNIDTSNRLCEYDTSKTRTGGSRL